MAIPVAFVIEDQVNISMLYEDALRLVGYDVVALRDGLVALNALETRDAPQLIVLDINLPRLSGRDIHKHIRSRDKYKEVPVIILTANSLMGERIVPDLTPRDHLFIKPIGMKEFQELAKAMKPGRDGVPDYMADTQRIPHLAFEETEPKIDTPKILTPSDKLETHPPVLEKKLSTQELKAIITPMDEMISLDDTDIPKAPKVEVVTPEAKVEALIELPEAEETAKLEPEKIEEKKGNEGS